ncbi:MAG: DegV family protein, partial [Oscillospiraceae bacterium]
MIKYAVLTDSACDIPPELEKEYGIDIMNFDITVDGKSYTERVDFTCDEFYEIARNAEGVPTTSHITSIRFCEKYCEYEKQGITEVLHVVINKSGSATYDASVMGEAQFRDEMPNSKLKIYRVDSHTYSMVYGFFVCEAAKKLKNGAEMGEVVRFLNDVFSRTEAV